MNEFMACAAQHRKPTRQFSFVEIAVDLTFSVPGSRDQMVPGQFRISPLAELTNIRAYQQLLDAKYKHSDARLTKFSARLLLVIAFRTSIPPRESICTSR